MDEIVRDRLACFGKGYFTSNGHDNNCFFLITRSKIENIFFCVKIVDVKRHVSIKYLICVTNLFEPCSRLGGNFFGLALKEHVYIFI